LGILKILAKRGTKGRFRRRRIIIPDVHAGDHAPEELRMLSNEHGPRGDAMNEQGSKKNGGGRGKWNAEYKKGNESRLARGIVWPIQARPPLRSPPCRTPQDA